MASLKPRHERAANDRYETPVWVVNEFLKIVPIRNDWKYLEPCRASGRFYNHMPLGSAWGEITEGVDYLETEYPHVDCVITNPPFLLAEEFARKALVDADVVIMLLRVGFLGSLERYDFWEENPPQHMISLSSRPSFTGDGKTDGADYCFYVWDKNGKLGLEKPFYWIKDTQGIAEKAEKEAERIKVKAEKEVAKAERKRLRELAREAKKSKK